jgi:hypothetical protein
MHLAFQFVEPHKPRSAVDRPFRMSRNGKHLGYVDCAECHNESPFPPAVYGELLTLSSIFCQRCFVCQKATVLHFIGDQQAYPLQAVALPLLN